jgi:DNA-binding CsgD family transcriptional regulator
MQELTNIYPFNLACDIFYGNKEEAEIIYVPGISIALTMLTEREQDVLKKRYCEKMTLRAIGEIHSVGPECIRQNEAKALRKLRHPSRTRLFKAVPLTEMLEQKAKYQRLSEDYDRLREAYERLKEDYEAHPNAVIPTAEAITVMQTPISELDLSVRSYNCLRRAGKNTLQDVVQMTEKELMEIRNLGRKSAIEVMAKVRSYGFEMRFEDLDGIF